LLDPMTKNDTLGLLADLGNLAMSLPPQGSSQVRALVAPLLVCPETNRSSSCKHDWLSFGGLLINMSVLHHVTVIFLAAFFDPWQPG
jgi:hypothetical protein